MLFFPFLASHPPLSSIPGLEGYRAAVALRLTPSTSTCAQNLTSEWRDFALIFPQSAEPDLGPHQD